MNLDAVAYLLLAALAAAVLYQRGRGRHEDHDGEGQALGDRHLLGPAADTTTAQEELRALDIVIVRCEHLDHRQPVTARITRAASARDHDQLQHHGWGSDHHSTLCRWHNRTRRPLAIVHVLCDRCPARDQLGTDTDAELGRLRNNGWHNTRDHQTLCPVCSGVRRRHHW